MTGGGDPVMTRGGVASVTVGSGDRESGVQWSLGCSLPTPQALAAG
jgi:hypothetical protein